MSPPRISVDGDESAALGLVPVAHNLLHKVRSSAATSGAHVTGLSLAPTPDSFIYALKVGDQEMLHIFVEPQTTYSPPIIEPTQAVDFVSGLIKRGSIELIDIPLPGGGTAVVQKLNSFRPTAETAKYLELKTQQEWYRSQRLAVRPARAFDDLPDPYRTNSQYVGLRPSMYSGRMSRLVQLVMGYGRLRQQQVAATGRDRETMIQEGVQVVYDHRWHRTHGITKATDGRLWLVEISIGRGVLAMPLPIIPNTARLKDTSQREPFVQAVLEFGGLPLGTGFPNGSALTAAIAEGTVIRLMRSTEVLDFYTMTPYSSAMGWTFNTAGSEAHNTGWYWHEDGFRRAAHYSVQIKIGATKKDRRPGEPLTAGSAKMIKHAEGVLYHPSAKFPPPIKFHEPLVGGLLSVEMIADYTAEVHTQKPLCMCPMHVIYVGDDLKVVWYFWDSSAGYKTETVSDFEECMVIGSWRSEVRYATQPSWPTFFTTDFDDRQPPDMLKSSTVMTSADAGWLYNLSDHPDQLQYATVWRDRVLRTATEDVTYPERVVRAAIVVPHGSRDSYIYTKIDEVNASQKLRRIAYRTLHDPNTYTTFRTFFYKPLGQSCYTQNDRKVFAIDTVSGSECSMEFANEGPWMRLCQNADLLPKRDLPEASSVIIGAPKVTTITSQLVTNSSAGTFKLNVTDVPDRWTVKSPDEFGSAQFCGAVFSCWGADHIAYDEGINGGQVRQGPLFRGEENRSSYCFIGYT